MRHSAWHWRRFLLALLAIQGVVLGADAKPQPEAEEATKFVRVRRDAQDEPLALETSVVRFESDKPGDRRVVDLIGAVHVGEKSYYEALNKLFDEYDVVLYELVAPEGTRIPKGAKTGSHPVGMIQNGMKNLLGLEHQLEYIDYTKEKMVHADMSPEKFAKTMENRGESFWTIFFKLMSQGMAQQAKQQAQGKSFDTDLLMALFDNNRALAMKRVMASQFEDMESTMQAFNGPDGSTIITERNKVALEGLTKQLKAGKQKVAIFYGAGHMNDMENRLQADFKLHRTNERWLTAWDLSGK